MLEAASVATPPAKPLISVSAYPETGPYLTETGLRSRVSNIAVKRRRHEIRGFETLTYSTRPHRLYVRRFARCGRDEPRSEKQNPGGQIDSRFGQAAMRTGDDRRAVVRAARPSCERRSQAHDIATRNVRSNSRGCGDDRHGARAQPLTAIRMNVADRSAEQSLLVLILGRGRKIAVADDSLAD